MLSTDFQRTCSLQFIDLLPYFGELIASLRFVCLVGRLRDNNSAELLRHDEDEEQWVMFSTKPVNAERARPEMAPGDRSRVQKEGPACLI
jgi:hypothetical protein